jgi:hypothetical protein
VPANVGDVIGIQQRPSDEVDPLARAGGDEDLVGAGGVAGVHAEPGQPLAQLREALDLEIAGDRRRLVARDLGRDLRQLARGAERRVGKAGRERDRAAGVRHVQRVAQHLVGVGERACREHRVLPVAGVGARGRCRGRTLADERPAADRRGDVAQLREAAVDAHGGEVVDAGVGGERAGRRELRPRLELAAVDEGGDPRDELLGERDLAAALEVQHVELV